MKIHERVIYLIAVLLATASCEKDPFDAFLDEINNNPFEYDDPNIPSLSFVFDVTNAIGEKLFDESTQDNWIDGPISATFRGKEYHWPQTESSPLRFYMNLEANALLFGDLNGGRKWDDDLSISWPDGSKDVIRVQHAIGKDKNGNIRGYTAFIVNGILNEDYDIHLQK